MNFSNASLWCIEERFILIPHDFWIQFVFSERHLGIFLFFCRHEHMIWYESVCSGGFRRNVEIPDIENIHGNVVTWNKRRLSAASCRLILENAHFGLESWEWDGTTQVLLSTERGCNNAYCNQCRCQRGIVPFSILILAKAQSVSLQVEQYKAAQRVQTEFSALSRNSRHWAG